MKKKIIKKVLKKKVSTPINALAVHNMLMESFDRLNKVMDRHESRKDYVIQCSCGRVLQITV